MTERIPFTQLSGEERYGDNAVAGDLAENAVAKVCAAMDRPVVPFAVRVSTKRGQHTTWAEIIQLRPDFLGWGKFIEAQGFGHNRKIVFKERKLDAMIYWNAIMPVWFAIYDIIEDNVIFCDLATILWAVKQPGVETMLLQEGTPYEKNAWVVPYEILLERKVNDAFAAERVERTNRKKAEGKQ